MHSNVAMVMMSLWRKYDLAELKEALDELIAKGLVHHCMVHEDCVVIGEGDEADSVPEVSGR